MNHSSPYYNTPTSHRVVRAGGAHSSCYTATPISAPPTDISPHSYDTPSLNVVPQYEVSSFNPLCHYQGRTTKTEVDVEPDSTSSPEDSCHDEDEEEEDDEDVKPSESVDVDGSQEEKEEGDRTIHRGSLPDAQTLLQPTQQSQQNFQQSYDAALPAIWYPSQQYTAADMYANPFIYGCAQFHPYPYAMSTCGNLNAGVTSFPSSSFPPLPSTSISVPQPMQPTPPYSFPATPLHSPAFSQGPTLNTMPQQPSLPMPPPMQLNFSFPQSHSASNISPKSPAKRRKSTKHKAAHPRSESKGFNRTVFRPEQNYALQLLYERTKSVRMPERETFAKAINLNEAQVKVWFQNRRYKMRKNLAMEVSPGKPSAEVRNYNAREVGEIVSRTLQEFANYMDRNTVNVHKSPFLSY